MNTYKTLIRPMLFRLDAERAHQIGTGFLRRGRLWSLAVRKNYQVAGDDRLKVDLAGISLASPVGLAAGLDKNGEMLDAMAALGFGYAIPGSIRSKEAADNPSPKIVRYADRESLVNCTGLPSKGAQYVASQLEQFRSRSSAALRVVANITGFSIDEYERVLDHVQPVADGIEISLSCPNERYESIDFLEPKAFKRLMIALNQNKERPFLVKIRNYNNEQERVNRFRLVELCLELGVEGVTLPGSRIVPEPALSLRQGNLSGRDVFEETIRNVRDVYALAGDQIAIKALGGIFTASDAFEAISTGATCVEMVTGVIYEGWSVARQVNEGLLRLLAEHSVPSIAALRGSDVRLSKGKAAFKS